MGLYYYLLYDMLIMCAVLFHTLHLVKLGIHQKTEEDEESIKEAMIRIVVCPLSVEISKL
jgi:hypothetical protein